MDRLELIQQLIDRRGYGTYLEIGVLGGGVFFKVKCKKKIAVDPDFRFNWKGKLGEMLKNGSNVAARYFEMTSDEFFANEADKVFLKKKADIILVDGMHEFDFVLNDVNNSLKHLSNDGIIIMHDCNPVTEEAACSFNDWKDRNFTGYWNGDTWKVVPYLRQARPDLEVFVADCDHGLGIVRKSNLKSQLASGGDANAFRTMSFRDLNNRREEMLNLKPASYLHGFVGG